MGWDAAAESMFGFTRDEALGKSSDELGIATLEAVKRMRKVLFSRPEEPVAHDLTLCRKDGSTFPAFVRFALAYDDDGAVVGTSVLILDATAAR